MAKPGYIAKLKNDAGALFSAAALTATDNSEKIDLAGYDRFGLVLDIGTVSGTSPTLNIKGQISLDDGTTWLDTFPGIVNSETQLTIAEITASKETSEFWDNPFPAIAGFSNSDAVTPRVRFVFTVAGTSPSFTFTNAYIVKKDFVGGA